MKLHSLFSALLLFVLPCALFTGCPTSAGLTLQAGGVYTDAVLAQADQSLLNAEAALTGFVQWQSANATYLAQWPSIGQLAAQVSAQKAEWIRDGYAARDAYAAAAKSYKDAIAAGSTTAVPPSTAKLDAALAVITNITSQINAYRTAHNV